MVRYAFTVRLLHSLHPARYGAFGTGLALRHVMYESAAGVKLQILLGEGFFSWFWQGVGTLQAGMTRACRAQTKVAGLVRDVFSLAALARSVR